MRPRTALLLVCQSAGERVRAEYLLAADKLLPDSGEVHGLLDDLPVAWHRLEVDRCEERPGVLVPL